MVKFKLKITPSKISVYQDGELIGEGDDYKEILGFVASVILKERIKDYEIYLLNRGDKEKLEPFYPEAHAKNYDDNDEDEEVEDDEEDSYRRRRHRRLDSRSRFSRDFEPERKEEFIYKPTSSKSDYKKMGLKLGDFIGDLK